MINNRVFLMSLFVVMFDFLSMNAQQVTSPNGKVSVNCVKGKSTISYNVSYMESGQKVNVFSLPSIGLLTTAGGEMKLLSISKSKYLKDSYTMLAGKRRICMNEANEIVFSFANSKSEKIDLRLRAYNDGIAFRYEYMPRETGVIKDELTTYKVPDGIKRWTQKYTTAYEDFYRMYLNGGEAQQWGYPALFQINDVTWALITEAGIDRVNCASKLDNSKDPSCYKVQPAQNDVKVSGKWLSPWRVAIIGSLADVVESTLVTDVSKPCEIKDTSWIKPGVVSWIYWCYNHGSKDFQIVKQYIDMAVTLKLPYVLIDWEWDVMGNGGNINDALAYAKEKGIKVLLWYNSSTAWADKNAAGPLFRLNKPDVREKEFSWLNKMGVSGVKIDFFTGDSLSTMNYYLDLLKDAAKHHLLIDFHGATIPRGWQRTYPNLMSVEAVYGAEWYNNAPTLTDKASEHNTTLPFTRNVVGPMDYTPCTFSDSQHPHITTFAHELALTVVFESALQNLADKPSSYLSQPLEVQHFFSTLPSTWDNTKLLSGYPGHHVVMARCKDGVWYIGGLNGTNEAMELSVDLSFLKKGNYTMTLFKDGKEARSFAISDENLSDRLLKIPTLPRGGFVAVIRK
jgi:hypothetical protein